MKKKMLEYMSVVRGGLAVQTSGGDRSWKGGVDLSGGGWYPSAHYEPLLTSKQPLLITMHPC